MKKKSSAGIPSRAVTVIAIVFGVFLFHWVNRALADAGMGGQSVFSSGTYQLTGADIITAIIGIILMMFGGKVHRFVRWVGIGMLGGQIGWEVYEFMQSTGYQA